MFKKFTNKCVGIFERYLPDPFLFCAFLSILVFCIAMPVTGQGPITMIGHWYTGFWKLLAFSMQMALILVTGHALASAPSFKRLLKRLAKIPKSPGQAIVLVTLISTVACWINWGFGLVIGAIFAKELAKEVKGVDYRLLIASAYSGFLVWHGGISGSIPLKVANTEGLAEATKGALTEAIPVSETIFAPFNLLILLVLLITLPLINKAMHPKKEETFCVDPSLLEDNFEAATKTKAEMTPAERLENHPFINIVLAIGGFACIVHYFVNHGFDLNLNIVNFIFLFTAIALHGTPRRFLDAIFEATKGCAGIILQFPFYAGIMGMMVGVNAVTNVSLAGAMSTMFVNISTQTTYPLFTFLSAGLVNFFVPSGGGQWAVQAPIMMQAGADLGVPAAKTAMAISWGDAWTNMIQPFWALPALGIAKLGAKDIMGFCLIDLLYSGVIISLFLMFM